jgi:nitrite reductase (NO-forming)
VDHNRRPRSRWHRAANAVVVGYLAASLVVAAMGAFGHASRWLEVHLFLLGAVTNAIIVWSRHFAGTLLAPAYRPERLGPGSLLAANAGVVAVLVGVTADITWLVVAGAAAIGVVVGAAGGILAHASWRKAAGRFAPAVRFYWVAALALVCGLAAGAAMEVGLPRGWYAGVFAAHVHLNVLGWIALTVLGTELSLWPMVLRTRVADTVELAGRQALLPCAAGLALAVVGLLAAVRPLAVAGVLGYLAGAARSLEPFVRTAWRRPPRTPAAWMLAAATGWLLAALCADVVALWSDDAVGAVADRLSDAVPWVLAGFALQVLLGALTYLLPVVVGGGPAAGRRQAGVLERAGLARTLALNIGVALIALPLPAPAATLGWWLVAASAAAFVVLAAIVLSGAAGSRATG